ncbi:MAG: branched-chain amino acid transport system ATP-binding protein [Actinomycetota bacterium]|jgi:branched-chain amino acid transport system ATP-binding protein|nr:branched-chain amino acid transport system ATP-binding protein [Actinomycetota bacterium]
MTSLPASVTSDPASAVPILQLAAVRAGYGRIDVLHGIELELRPGEVFALLGPNGAGKSTTLAVASGQIAPSSGGVFLCGREVTGAAPDALARAGVCLIPEGRGIFPNLTVAENLRMATFTGHSYQEVLELAFAQFPRLGERRKQTAGTMSGGEQQMLSMARALATEPAVLLIDELSMGLAPIIVEELYEHVRRIAASGLSILIVEQFAHEILGLADRAGIMLHGRLLHTGPPASIADELADAYLGADHPAPG